jgi:hypothetical protein
MSSQAVLNLLIGLLILGLVMYRQLQSRPVRGRDRLLLILLVIGLLQAAHYLQRVHADTVAIAALAGSLVLAAVFGALRAFTTRIWLHDGQPWVRGNLLTAALWLVAIGAHLGYDYLVGKQQDIGAIGTATVLLYLVASLGLQRLVVAYRAQRLEPAAPPAPTVGP